MMSGATSIAVQLAAIAYQARLRSQGLARAHVWLDGLPTSRYAWFLLPGERESLPALVLAAPVPLHLSAPSTFWSQAA